MIRLYLAIALFFITIPAFADTQKSIGLFQDDFDILLAQHTKMGFVNDISVRLVDYHSWGENEAHIMALAHLKSVDTNLFTHDDEKMAFFINAYNFLTIDLIIQTGEQDSIRNQGRIWQNVWKRFSWDIGGKDFTLHQIEHEILRPMNDPRIHMAVNCASLSCPDLRHESYRADRLNSQLEEQVRHFLRSPDETKGAKGYQLKGDRLYLSKIFDWFQEDFAHDGFAHEDDELAGIMSFFGHYLGQDKTTSLFKENKIKYLPYDWQLNDWALNSYQ